MFNDLPLKIANCILLQLTAVVVYCICNRYFLYVTAQDTHSMPSNCFDKAN